MNRALVGLALAAVVIVAVALVARGRSRSSAGVAPGPADAQQPSPRAEAGGGPVVQVERPVKVVLECEKPSKLEDKEPGGKPVMRMGSASMGEVIGYLEIPDGWIKDYGLEKVKDNNTGGALPGKAFYAFEAPRQGEYYVFIRAQWFDSCGDSVFFRVDDGDYEMIEDTEGKVSDRVYRWAWHPLKSKGECKALPLKAGAHCFELATREDGPKFDKVLLTTDPTPPGRDVVDP